ncbi:MAG: hypothetical protein K2N73_05565 [Lachnospiraceae bacterium]|nr:hypothetical protein [Lachnospiraceae bacterium]
MRLRELSAGELSDIYNNYMVKDFPADELKPLERILYTMKTGLCSAYGIFEQNDLRGYAVFIVPEGVQYGLLDYLAVMQEYRGTGVGHAFFRLVGETLAVKYPQLLGLFIESEDTAFAADGRERTVREKRISFYRQNGCIVTSLGSRLFGVTYCILAYNFAGSPDRMPTLQELDDIYTAMFKQHHYKNNVRLWQYED